MQMSRMLPALLALTLALQVQAQSAVEVMKMVENRNMGGNSQALIQLDINRDGSRKTRVLSFEMKNFDAYRASEIRLQKPASLADTAYLTYDYHQLPKKIIWSYLPALNKTKQIPLSDHKQSFLASDISFADLLEMPWSSKYKLTMERENEQVNERDCWQMLAKASDEELKRTGIIKSRLWVDKEYLLIVRAINYMKYSKKYILLKDIELIDGVWMGRKILVQTRNERGGSSSTQLQYLKISYNQGSSLLFVPEELLTR